MIAILIGIVVLAVVTILLINFEDALLGFLGLAIILYIAYLIGSTVLLAVGHP